MYRCWTLLISALLYLFININVFAQLPNDYQDLSAKQKQDLLWDEVVKSHKFNPLPKLSGNSFKEVLEKIKGIFTLSATFDHFSDEIPKGRVKIIHANGSVAKIAFIPTPNHPFTGIYQQGAIGVARFSLAISPTDTTYIPGMAIKFLVSGNPSLNLQVMNSLEGQQENWNYFAKEFTNHIAHPTSWTLKAIEQIFEWTRDPANDLPLWHLAAWTSEGKFKGIPVFPEQIYFRPSNAVTEIIPENSREDFRLSFAKIPQGPLYEVYGKYHGQEYHIGTLMLESDLLASYYGDKELFFQHQR
ncbi:Uncharacterised protein [Legionella busanensis]|uniref:Uncharacterized protein n=1 Tax=Legionella busanensis TaxID=190655 RepID=A0A378JIZ4_9GAMM|nr:hypothetical protein [Legionella busanensis]STX51037.1 Uncharacterised protein [Legionella busanensis]